MPDAAAAGMLLPMKKLAVAIAGALFLAASAPVFACPHEDKNEVKTAEKDQAKEQDKAKTADKSKSTDKDKAKKEESKPVAKN